MMLFPNSQQGPAGLGRRLTLLAFGAIIFGGAGTLLVKASDNPAIVKVMQEFNRPIRQAVEPYMPRPSAPLPQLFRARTPQTMHVLNYAPRTEALQPPPRLSSEPLRIKPQPLVLPEAQADQPPRKRARQKLNAPGTGRGASVATNYCVRLCDGFAFPVGNAGTGDWNVQESACRSACPGAATALYTAPAGAQDFDALSRGGQSYTALPAAFQYRDKVSNTCSCRAVGATQSTAALLTDPTLRRGDIAMTRAGVRHFDGGARMPYRASQFSDALTRLTSKREVAIVRAMEVASVRGILSTSASPEVRNRVVIEIRQAEQAAARAKTADARGLSRGFVELQAREKIGPVAMPTVKRPPGLVAMN